MVTYSVLDSHDPKIISEFCSGVNLAFSSLKNILPLQEFIPVDFEKLLQGGDTYIAFGIENGVMVCGLCLSLINKFGKRVAHISKVWCMPGMQGKGYATELLKYTEAFAEKHNAECLLLSVIRSNVRALTLYRLFGFRCIGIYAFIPNTSYFLEMLKPLKSRYLPVQFVAKLLISSLKFIILFQSDSTPRWIYKVLYGKK